MGCDIHLAVELRESENKPWKLLETPKKFKYPYKDWHYKYVWGVWRDYKLFGVLAGVRDDSVQMIANPRGIPADATKLWKKYCNGWGDDMHSMSYLTLEEVLVFSYGDNWMDGKLNTMGQISEQFAEMTKYLIDSVLSKPGMLPKNIRFVFGFDN